MKELSDKIRKGDKLMIYKANQIIPQIASIEFLPTSSSKIIEIPKTCPICGGDTSIHRNNDSEVLYCDNPNCSGKLLNHFKHFVGKKGLDIKGISEATLEKLMDWGWLNTYQDIFLLKEYRDKWIQKPGFGEASVDKILNAIEESKKTSLERIIAAAGIPEIGSRVAKDLAKHYNSWADFRAETNFLQYDGIGEVMNNNLLNFNYEEIDEIVKKYLIFEKNNDIINIEKENKLNDLTFVITGKLHNYKNRDELVSIIEANGGKVVGSVTKNTNYLINNDINSNSSKNIKAKQLNIPILTEEEFIKMI